jgi:putative ABC transport system substrate-binding protein
MNNRRKLVMALGAGTLAAPFGSFAQSARKPRRIGFLSGGSIESNVVLLDAFRAGMTELRWIEGRDFTLDARYADGSVDTLRSLAGALVATKSDLLLAAGDTAIELLAQNTKTIPIVAGSASDPVASGFAASLGRPGGNITGLSNIAPDLAAKRLQLLKEALPRLTHAALLFTPEESNNLRQVKATTDAAAYLGVRITSIEVRAAADIEPAFKRGATAGAQAFVVISSSIIRSQRRTITTVATGLNLPVMYPASEYAEIGGLMSYSAPLRDQFRRAAYYVVRVLDGAEPGNLPIEQPTRFELVVNLRIAKAMRFNFPQSFLARADRVID